MDFGLRAARSVERVVACTEIGHSGNRAFVDHTVGGTAQHHCALQRSVVIDRDGCASIAGVLIQIDRDIRNDCSIVGEITSKGSGVESKIHSDRSMRIAIKRSGLNMAVVGQP